jgi:single-strand DNA-binding protein
MQLTGRIKLINDTQTYDSGFCKREIVVTTAEQYPQDIKLEFVKDKCDILDKYKIGDSVIVDFNIRGNEFNGKYYVNLQGWKINHDNGGESENNQQAQQPNSIPEIPEIPLPMADESDDLPF